MDHHRTRWRRLLCCSLLLTAGLLALTGCRVAASTAGASPGGQVQTFVTDFVHQALAAFLL